MFLLEANGPTSYSNRLILILKVIACTQLILGAGKLCLNFFAGMTDIISSFVIFYAACKLNFRFCSMYVIGAIANTVIIVATVGIYIQSNSQPLFSMEPFRIAFYIVSAISVVFYIVACHFAFESYKEFKAIAFHLFQNNNESMKEDLTANERIPSFQGNSIPATLHPLNDQDAARKVSFENFSSFGKFSYSEANSPVQRFASGGNTGFDAKMDSNRESPGRGQVGRT